MHHLLTIYALGATPSEIERAYDINKTYQRPNVGLDMPIVKDMHDPEKFKKYLGKEKYYYDFVTFFQQEMDQKGWKNVLNDYLLKGDERADDLLVRTYAGKLEPH